MATKSAGRLHAIVSGDASPYIAELRRADEATRARAASISSQIDKLGGDLSKKFSFADIGKGLLGGFGLGSGAAVIMTGVEYFRDMWKESAEYAKTIEERAKDIAKALQELRGARFDARTSAADPDERLGIINREIARVATARDEADEARQKAMRGFAFGNNAKGSGVMIKRFEGEYFTKDGTPDGLGTRVREFTDEMLKRADEAQLKWIERTKELEKLSGQVISTLKELEAEAKKRRDEQMKADDYQMELSIKQALRETPDKSGLKEITPDDEARAAAGLKKYEADLAKAAERRVDAMERENPRLKADEMTRRGLGTGADYSSVNKTRDKLLGEIRDLLKQLTRNTQPQYSD